MKSGSRIHLKSLLWIFQPIVSARRSFGCSSCKWLIILMTINKSFYQSRLFYESNISKFNDSNYPNSSTISTITSSFVYFSYDSSDMLHLFKPISLVCCTSYIFHPTVLHHCFSLDLIVLRISCFTSLS